jgi:hypothetical protein
MVESGDWSGLTFVLSPLVQLRDHRFPSSPASRLSSAHLQILAPSIFFRPDDHGSKYQNLSS